MEPRFLLFLGLLFLTPNVYAEETTIEQPEKLDRVNCLLEEFQNANGEEIVSDIRGRCPTESDTEKLISKSVEGTVISRRWNYEQQILSNPFALSAHRPNYFIPALYIHNPNSAPFENDTTNDAGIERTEFQFQLSIKYLLTENIFGLNAAVYGAYTNRSFWQAYNSDISSPFRETNHEPELMLAFPSQMSIYGFKNIANLISFNHQSNGRPAELSRSWNRIMFETIWEKEGVVVALKPWYRLREPKDEYIGDPIGDDNPDIETYMGQFELRMTHNRGDHHFQGLLRNNLSKNNKGAIELGWSFPINRNLRGFVKYFNGYGESLIDYNANTTSVGLGFILSEWI